jgi:hypothetical protein
MEKIIISCLPEFKTHKTKISWNGKKSIEIISRNPKKGSEFGGAKRKMCDFLILMYPADCIKHKFPKRLSFRETTKRG